MLRPHLGQPHPRGVVSTSLPFFVVYKSRVSVTTTKVGHAMCHVSNFLPPSSCFDSFLVFLPCRACIIRSQHCVEGDQEQRLESVYGKADGSIQQHYSHVPIPSSLFVPSQECRCALFSCATRSRRSSCGTCMSEG